MIFKTEYLIPGNEDCRLDCYLSDAITGLTRKAILVIPGGGYGIVCSDREGEPIAQAFVPYGFQAFVLHYTVGRKRVYPAQLIEASLAIRHIREHAKEYGIDPQAVFATGFSAGGHLAGSLGILWNRTEVVKAVGGEYGCNRPDGIILGYSVICSEKGYSHQGSFFNLLGTDTPTEEQMASVSLEKHVTKESAPLFLMHSSDDTVVGVRNALDLAAAYNAQGLRFEMHIYPSAPHGLALGNKVTACNNPGWTGESMGGWVELAARWTDFVTAGKE